VLSIAILGVYPFLLSDMCNIKLPPLRDTARASTFGEDIDSFLVEFIPEDERKRALIYLNLIAMKAIRSGRDNFKSAVSRLPTL
jgi:hypothetical protein